MPIQIYMDSPLNAGMAPGAAAPARPATEETGQASENDGTRVPPPPQAGARPNIWTPTATAAPSSAQTTRNSPPSGPRPGAIPVPAGTSVTSSPPLRVAEPASVVAAQKAPPATAPPPTATGQPAASHAATAPGTAKEPGSTKVQAQGHVFTDVSASSTATPTAADDDFFNAFATKKPPQARKAPPKSVEELFNDDDVGRAPADPAAKDFDDLFTTATRKKKTTAKATEDWFTDTKSDNPAEPAEPRENTQENTAGSAATQTIPSAVVPTAGMVPVQNDAAYSKPQGVSEPPETATVAPEPTTAPAASQGMSGASVDAPTEAPQSSKRSPQRTIDEMFGSPAKKTPQKPTQDASDTASEADALAEASPSVKKPSQRTIRDMFAATPATKLANNTVNEPVYEPAKDSHREPTKEPFEVPFRVRKASASGLVGSDALSGLKTPPNGKDGTASEDAGKLTLEAHKSVDNVSERHDNPTPVNGTFDIDPKSEQASAPPGDMFTAVPVEGASSIGSAADKAVPTKPTKPTKPVQSIDDIFSTPAKERPAATAPLPVVASAGPATQSVSASSSATEANDPSPGMPCTSQPPSMATAESPKGTPVQPAVPSAAPEPAPATAAAPWASRPPAKTTDHGALPAALYAPAAPPPRPSSYAYGPPQAGSLPIRPAAGNQGTEPFPTFSRADGAFSGQHNAADGRQLDHPPGYAQNTYSANVSSPQGAVSRTSSYGGYNSHGGYSSTVDSGVGSFVGGSSNNNTGSNAGYLGTPRGGDGGVEESYWQMTKRLAWAVGETISAAEAAVWRRFGV